MQTSAIPMPAQPALFGGTSQLVFAAGRRTLCSSLRSLSAWSARSPSIGRCYTARVQAAAVAEVASELEVPKPTVDLHSNLPSGSHWAGMKEWVVFSDLHVSTKTVKVCCEVLQRVRQEAEARNAGIIFLGDFWHARGALPVTPLNLVIQELQQWRQPTLMLVGNHDQVTLGGLVHGLAPLAAACPAVHVFERPTLFLDALWLPYRRECSEIEAAIRSSGPLKAVFGHADVLGAFVNETFQAREGLEPALFPAVPSYLGHYHKPHTVRDTSIRYTGSPYQVSRSESGQQKELIVLDSNWQQVGAAPLDLGPRHFNISLSTSELPADVRAGDRVRWTLPECLDASDAQPAVSELEQKGIEVEVIVPPAKEAPRIEEAEDLGALALFQLYADTVQMSPEARSKGLSILEGLEGDQGGPQLRHQAAQVSFKRLELEGFGPFRDEVEYDLDSRGLRVVSGRNEDDTGADSNGAGKSALVMATLWCLTGRSDARTLTANARGMTGAELVNDSAKLARVRVEGSANGEPFTVERSVRRRGLASLRFTHAGEDLTGAEARLTQAEMDRVLGCQLLTRVVFHSQADVAGLLEADDREFKAELGRVVEMDAWDAAKLVAAEQLRAARHRALQLEQELSVRSAYLADLDAKVEAVTQRAAAWEASLQQRAFEAEDAVSHAAVDARLQLGAVQLGSQQLQLLLDADWAEQQPGPPVEPLDAAEHLLDTLPGPSRDVGDAELAAELRSRLQALQQQQDQQRLMLGSSTGALQASAQQLEEYEGLQRGGAQSVVCDRCLQPIEGRVFQDNLARLRAQVAAARQAQQQVEADATRSQEAFEVASQELRECEQRLAGAQLQAQQELWRRKAAVDARRAEDERIQADLEHSRQTALARRAFAETIQSRASGLVSQLEPLLADCLGALPAPPSAQPGISHAGSLEQATQELLHLVDIAQMAGSHLMDAKGRRERLGSESNPHSGEASVLQGLVASETAALEAAKAGAAQWQQEAEWARELDAAFGRTGVQSFALEGILGELQKRSAHFLEQLSSGTSLILSASRQPAGAKGRNAAAPAVERITKTVLVRSGPGAGAAVRERSVRQLSGGERRRVALALALGFADLVAARARLRCNLLVLDEVLQQLDEEGCARMAQVLRGLPQPNILVVGQADSYVMQVFDKADIVVKRNGCSYVEQTA